MIQKLRTLIFFTTLLTMGAFSVHAMEESAEDKQKVLYVKMRKGEQGRDSQIFALYGRYPTAQEKPIELNECIVSPIEYEDSVEEEASDDENLYLQKTPLSNDEYEVTEENSVLFSSFEVDSREVQNVVNHFQDPRNAADFGRLVEFFECIPQTKKIEAVKNLESKMCPTIKLNNFKYTSEGAVIETPYKAKGSIPLRSKLLGLPCQPEGLNTHKNVNELYYEEFGYMYHLNDPSQSRFIQQRKSVLNRRFSI